MNSPPVRVPLNRSEHMYWAGEGYLGPINQAYMLRLDRHVDEALVRQTLRELNSAFPRLRGVLDPGWWSFKLRILPDDLIIDQLFDDAYRVQRGVDPSDRSALQSFHTEFMNEPISLERGLPWRARFLPHPTQPALLFSVHHIIGDGRSMVQMVTAIMGRLSGQPIRPCPLGSPSMVAAVTPPRWRDWPSTITAWRRVRRADRQRALGQQVITLASRRSERYTTSAVRYHELNCQPDELRATAKAMGTTVNTLIIAVLANSFLARSPNNPQAVAAIRMSIDLRRFLPEARQAEFGNFVSSFAVRATHQASLQAQIRDVDAQIKENMARYEQRVYALPLMLAELLPWVGRTLYSHLILKLKRRHQLPPLSCHFSNLGSAEMVHPATPQVRVEELWPTTLSTALIIGLVSLSGKLFLSVIRQCDETDDSDLDGFLAVLDEQLEGLSAPVEA